MTNDEAIKILDGIDRLIGDDFYGDTIEEAIEMAIEALKCELSKDGTLKVKVEDATKIGRVLISDDKHRGGLYYPDEDEPKSDLISRAEAIEAVNRAKDEGMINCPTYYLGIVPSADRPKGKWVNKEGVYGAVYCSECNYELRVNNTNFCPNCGADMRSEADYKRAIEQMERDTLYESTYSPEDGSM